MLTILTISETRFLSFLGGQRFHRLQVEIVIQMKIVQVLTMNQQIEHIVTLATHLQTSLNPIKGSGLKEFCCFE